MIQKNICKKFFFARHGQTDWNQKQLCQGQLDVELNDAGRQEAKLLAQLAKKWHFSKIVSSPLRRALETAKIVQDELKIGLFEINDDFKERCWGELEGESSLKMYAIEELEEQSPGFFPEKGIEHREVFKKRILRGLNKAFESEGTPLIVSHGRLFLSLCEVLQMPLVRQIPNTALVEFSPNRQGWTMNVINDCHEN